MDKERMEKDVPSDVVELIIAVDLNPSDPQEPLNVNDVKVRDKGAEGEDGGEDWRDLCMQLLMGDPKSGVTSNKISFDEAVDAVAAVLEDSDEPKEEKADPFEKAMSKKPKRTGMPMMGGKNPFGDKPKPSGMKMALDKALGREDKDDDDDEEF